MPPAARVGDPHVCPLVNPGGVPHVGLPILPPGCPTVLIGGMPAARVGDMCGCVGPPDVIAQGSPTVYIGMMMAARQGDMTAHGGAIVIGCFTVVIGETGQGYPGGGGGSITSEQGGPGGPGGAGAPGGASKKAPIDDPAVKEAMRKALEDSDVGGKNPHEEGGWILRDPKTGKLSVERIPAGKKDSIDWNVQNGKRGNKDIVGSFHTHPNDGPGWRQGPSPQDKTNVKENPGTFGKDHYVVSKEKVYHVDRKGKESETGKTSEVLK